MLVYFDLRLVDLDEPSLETLCWMRYMTIYMVRSATWA